MTSENPIILPAATSGSSTPATNTVPSLARTQAGAGSTGGAAAGSMGTFGVKAGLAQVHTRAAKRLAKSRC